MYYSNGNYEAFARPKKPEGVDDKNAYIIGTGLAALTAAATWCETRKCRAATFTYSKRTRFREEPATARIFPVSAM